MYIGVIEEKPQEVKVKRLWPEGLYNFEVSAAEDAKSKSGNDMITLTIRIFGDNNEDTIIWDYIVDKPNCLFKAKKFLQCVGKKFENVHLAAYDCIGQSGKLYLGIQKGKTGKYGDRNVVKYYYVEPENESQVTDDFDEDLPF